MTSHNTGGLLHEEGVRQIPAAAISVLAAERLSSMLSESPEFTSFRRNELSSA